MKRLSALFTRLKLASKQALSLNRPFASHIPPNANYLAILPFLVISQQHFLESHCFFSSGPKKNKMESRVAAIQYQSNNPIEDTYSCEQVISGIEGYFISVFDGHGGWQLSNYARENLSNLFKESLAANLKQSPSHSTDEIIIKSIQDSYRNLEQNYYNMVLSSYKMGFHQVGRVGSCALSAFIHENKLYIANLGDCKATLIKNEKGSYSAQKLTHKLNANSKKEQARMRKQFPEDKEIFSCRRGDNSACYVKNSLQPTRSFGDFRLKYPEFNNPDNRGQEYGYPRKIYDFKGPYISAEPEISVFELSSNDRFLVMGSDGLWDELNQRDVAKIVGENQRENKNVIVEKIFNAAFEHAAKTNKMSVQELKQISAGSVRRKLHDDITLIVVDLKNQGR